MLLEEVVSRCLASSPAVNEEEEGEDDIVLVAAKQYYEDVVNEQIVFAESAADEEQERASQRREAASQKATSGSTALPTTPAAGRKGKRGKRGKNKRKNKSQNETEVEGSEADTQAVVERAIYEIDGSTRVHCLPALTLLLSREAAESALALEVAEARAALLNDLCEVWCLSVRWLGVISVVYFLAGELLACPYPPTTPR